MKHLRLSICLLMLAAAVPVFATNYVLMSGRWHSAQTNAVTAAGGVVTFAHGPTGIGIASSDDPDFAERLAASGAFSTVARDMSVRTTPSVRTIELEAAAAAVTPENETFWNLQWSARAINAPAAWAAGYTGRGVRIAIVDGGLHAAHLDLRDNVDTARSKSFVPGLPFNSDVGTGWDATLMAGVIAASDRNNLGIIGVAPEATIIGVKVIDDHVGELSWLVSGILYAADPIAEGGAGADIIQIGIAVPLSREGGGGPLISAVAKAVNYATSRGVLVVAGAGSERADLGQPTRDRDPMFMPLTRTTVFVPAESGNAVSVSATGPAGFGFGMTDFMMPAMYSNFGEGAIWVAAPGGGMDLEETPEGTALCSIPRIPSGVVTRQCWFFDMVFSTARGSGTSIGTYTFGAGTGMASAHVAAVAALVKQRHPGISVGALKTILANTADDEGRTGVDQFYGHGFVNAGNAVQ